MLNYVDSNNQTIALTGAEAAAEAMRQINPGVVPVYPITPQTPIIEEFANYVAKGEIKTEIITAESEHSVMSAAIGSAAAGSRTMTATSSQGLALMYEILYIASGMRFPIVMNVANRAVSSPINIHCDHSDTMGVRDCGWIQIYSETAQEAYDHNLLAVRLAEHPDIMLPAMVMQDGFVTSHLLEKMEMLSDSTVEKFVGDYQYPYSLLGSRNIACYVPTMGALMLPDYFFETKLMEHNAFEKASQVYKEIALELEKITQRNHSEIELYNVNENTEGVIITMSSAAGTVKEVVDRLNKKGKPVGMIKVRLFRPFPYSELGAVIKSLPVRQAGITNIAVLDRTFSFGSMPPLYSEVIQTLKVGTGHCPVPTDTKIQSYVFGLGGRDLREKDVAAVYENILSGNYTAESKFLNCKI